MNDGGGDGAGCFDIKEWAMVMSEPIAFETMGPMNLSALNLLNDLGRKISSVSDDDREGHFLFQRLSVI